jgi:hypothetical protein
MEYFAHMQFGYGFCNGSVRAAIVNISSALKIEENHLEARCKPLI